MDLTTISTKDIKLILKSLALLNEAPQHFDDMLGTLELWASFHREHIQRQVARKGKTLTQR